MIPKCLNGSKNTFKQERIQMLILSVNKILKWCQITTGERRYTCPTKIIDGKLYFHFKRTWHPVANYISDHTHELVEEGGRIFSRTFRE